MSSKVNALNRVVLALLGLLLVAAGALGLALALGTFGAGRRDASVLPGSVRSYPGDHPWFWWAVAGGCLLVALLALRWLLAQFHTDRTSRIDRTTDARTGYTIVHAGAINEAAAEDARTIGGVINASAHVSHDPPRLQLQVDLADYADLTVVRDQLESGTVEHVREAMGDETFPVDIELRPGASQTPGRSIV